MLYIVVNGAMKHQDWALMKEKLSPHAELTRADDRILVALQGPEAVDVVTKYFPEAADLTFMECLQLDKDDMNCLVTRAVIPVRMGSNF